MDDINFLNLEPSISVILPCYNEAASVGSCIEEALIGIASTGLDGEVLVVDNNSTDNSVEISLSHGARVISESQPGYGSAIRAGIECARGSLLIMADADLTYELTALKKLIVPIINNEADLVLGRRVVESRAAMPFLHQHLGTPILTKLVKHATGGVKITDSQSGFRAFSKEAVLKLELASTGMEFASEMLIKAARHNFRISEVDTIYRTRVGESKLNAFTDGMRHLREIFLLAPFSLLIVPSGILFAIGLIVEILSLINPDGIKLGSMLWQPVFFSGIAMIVSLQALLAGLFLSMRSGAGSGAQLGIQDQKWFKLILPVGIVTVFSGILIDGGILAQWLIGSSHLTVQAPLASLAQTFLIDGISLTGFGIFVPMFERPPTRRISAPEIISGIAVDHESSSFDQGPESSTDLPII